MNKSALFSALATLLLATACGTGPNSRDTTLIWARGADASGLDPAAETDGESLNVAANIYDGLVQFKIGTTEVEPALAKSWEISADAKTYTFHLRENVKFHDGTPFNADAVVFSLERQRDPSHPGAKCATQFGYWGAMGMDGIVKKVEKIDELTVVIHLIKAEAPLMSDLGMQFAAIVSPTAALKYCKEFGRHPVGAGPYKFVEWQAGQKIVLEANNDYWGGKPTVQKVIWTVIKDLSTRTQAYLAGQIDGFEGINPFELEKIKASPRTQVLTQPGMNVFYLAMHMDKKPFDNLKVRQAVAYAINKERIVKNFYQGMGTVASTMLPESLWGHADLPPYPYDPAKAKSLLKEAGFPNGFETEFWYMTAPRPYAPAPGETAAQIRLDLEEVGIKAKMVTYDWTTYLQKTQKGEHILMQIGWSGDNGDPDNFLYTLLSTDSADAKPAQNYSFYRDPEVDALFNKAKGESKFEARVDYYKQAQKLIYDRYPVVPIASSLQVVVASDRIQNLILSPDTRKHWEKVQLLPVAGK